jgi:hypothetical protein
MNSIELSAWISIIVVAGGWLYATSTLWIKYLDRRNKSNREVQMWATKHRCETDVKMTEINNQK